MENLYLCKFKRGDDGASIIKLETFNEVIETNGKYKVGIIKLLEDIPGLNNKIVQKVELRELQEHMRYPDYNKFFK